MKPFLAALFVALSIPAAACGTAAAADPLTFVLAGQSNMVGLAYPVPAEAPDPSVSVLEPDGSWRPATDPLYPGGGVGPSIAFGDTIAAATGRPVRLIPCAYSGTRIAEWLPGYVAAGASDPAEYEACVTQTLASGARIDGVIFDQGETDAMLPEWANVWAYQFGLFVADIRRDLGAAVPVVFAQIGSGDGWQHGTPGCLGFCSWATVQAQQASVPIPGVAMIQTNDLAAGSDNLHLTAAAYQTLGRRLAAAWLAPPPATAPVAPAAPSSAAAAQTANAPAAPAPLSISVAATTTVAPHLSFVARVKVATKPVASKRRKTTSRPAAAPRVLGFVGLRAILAGQDRS